MTEQTASGSSECVENPDLLPEQKAELREAFNMFDKDNDGTITLAELTTVMRALGQTLSDSELGLLMNSVDTNQDGVIDFEEFVALMRSYLRETEEETEMIEAFRVFDKDGNGMISAEELREAMLNLGEKMTQDELEEMIRAADTDGNGQIDYTEFVAMMRTR